MAAHSAIDLIDLKLNHLEQFRINQLVENDYLIKTVYELGVERLPHRRHHHFFHLLSAGIYVCLESEGAFLLNEAGSDVGSHDDN